jgi:hypothetical protein
MRQVETLWPVASTLKGNGRFSGHVRGPLDDLREEVEQLLSFGEGQPAECRNLDLPDPGEDLVRRGRACWGDLHEEASPVVGIRLADDPPAALEQIEGGRHGGRGNQNPIADLRGGEGSPGTRR